MKFSSKHIWFISSLAALALTGLIVIQMSWLKGVFHEREAKLIEKMDQLLEVVNQQYMIEVEGDFDLEAILYHDDAQEESMFLQAFQEMFDEVLKNEGINTSYEYGLITCKSDRFKWYTDLDQKEDIMQGHTVKLGECGQLSDLKSGEHFHFYTFLPRKSLFIFKQLGLAIGSSLFFILILIGAFAYTLATIARQKKLSEMKSAFINNLTHEFKTPIATISLAARTLNRLKPEDGFKKAKIYASLIDQESKRLENQVDKILQMAVIDAGNFSLDLKPVDVHASIQQVLDSLKLIIEKKGGQFDLDLRAHNSVITADELHLFNIIYNLVDNAIKYSPIAPFIRIETNNSPNLELTIQDNGIGMSKAVQQQIFSPFFRSETGDAHDVKGFGLGLSYVKKMMDAHKGTISVKSQAGNGTSFTLFFQTPQSS